MILTKINLINFRNYDKLELDLDKNFNVIVGQNAQGKTNILESIYVLALTKSYRTINENNLVRFGENSFFIKGKVKSSGNSTKILEIFYDSEKLLKINKKKVNKVAEYISNLNIILMTPDNIDIIKGSPIVRRNFLNIEISQISKNYLKIYNEFNKLLKMRNEYLKMININGISDKRYLDTITDKLIEKEVDILLERKHFVQNINNKISDIFNEIFGSLSIYIKYKTSIDVDCDDVDTLKQRFKELYIKNEKKELEAGMTLFGPHRDDFTILIDNKDIKEYGSQGQQKLAMIALKLAEIDTFTEFTGSNPILLLDDIFSELDREKRKKLLKYIVGKGQIIITANELNEIRNINIGYKIFNIKNKKVTEKVIVNGTSTK